MSGDGLAALPLAQSPWAAPPDLAAREASRIAMHAGEIGKPAPSARGARHDKDILFLQQPCHALDGFASQDVWLACNYDPSSVPQRRERQATRRPDASEVGIPSEKPAQGKPVERFPILRRARLGRKPSARPPHAAPLRDFGFGVRRDEKNGLPGNLTHEWHAAEAPLNVRWRLASCRDPREMRVAAFQQHPWRTR